MYQSPTCLICQSPGARYKFSAKGDSDKEFKIFKCPGCKIAFTFPLPDREELKRYYDHGYYGEDARRLYFLRELVMRVFHLDRRKIVESYKRKGRLMDVGCGDGRFLKDMRRCGWEVYGVETSKAASALLKGIKDIKYFNGELADFNFPSDYFDVITLWHVLEHLDNPLLELSEIARILKKDGVLFIAVPNFASLQARFGEDLWVHLDPPWHRWHFSPESLSFVINNSRLAIRHQIFLSYSYNLFGWWQTILNRMGLPFNQLVHFFKREEINKKLDILSRFSSQLFIAVSILFLPLFFFLTSLEFLLNKNGTITLVVRKRQQEP